MKKVYLMIGCLVVIFGFWVLTNHTTKQHLSFTVKPTTSAIPTQKITQPQTTSLFVPYWSVPKQKVTLPAYDFYIYFGVSPTSEGINQQDAGYLRLEQFMASVPKGKNTYLTVRMLDDKASFAILKDSAKQSSIIFETIDLAKTHNFDGIVLDLELSALPFDSLIQQINTFVKELSLATKKENMTLSMTLYGDTFYRIRPFDVKTLAGSVDQVMIMAYDLHKANGNPGPNFPLSGKETYGYDYSQLTNQFSAAMPPEKLTVIFGLFGYDWQVDEKGISQKIGKARSMIEMQEQIVAKCKMLQCVKKRDSTSGEMMVKYVDEDGKRHSVWYEDMESVVAKQNFLKTKGITNFSYWAWPYF